MFFPYRVKTSKWSGNCNNINNPFAILCVSDIVKNLNVKVFNIVSGTDDDDDLSLNKPLKFHAMTINIKSFFEEGKLYLQDFLDDALYEL